MAEGIDLILTLLFGISVIAAFVNLFLAIFSLFSGFGTGAQAHFQRNSQVYKGLGNAMGTSGKGIWNAGKWLGTKSGNAVRSTGRGIANTGRWTGNKLKNLNQKLVDHGFYKWRLFGISRLWTVVVRGAITKGVGAASTTKGWVLNKKQQLSAKFQNIVQNIRNRTQQNRQQRRQRYTALRTQVSQLKKKFEGLPYIFRRKRKQVQATITPVSGASTPVTGDVVDTRTGEVISSAQNGSALTAMGFSPEFSAKIISDLEQISSQNSPIENQIVFVEDISDEAQIASETILAQYEEVTRNIQEIEQILREVNNAKVDTQELSEAEQKAITILQRFNAIAAQQIHQAEQLVRELEPISQECNRIKEEMIQIRQKTDITANEILESSYRAINAIFIQSPQQTAHQIQIMNQHKQELEQLTGAARSAQERLRIQVSAFEDIMSKIDAIQTELQNAAGDAGQQMLGGVVHAEEHAATEHQDQQAVTDVVRQETRVDRQLEQDLNQLYQIINQCKTQAAAVGSASTLAQQSKAAYNAVVKLRNDIAELDRLEKIEVTVVNQELKDWGVKKVAESKYLRDILNQKKDLRIVLDRLAQKLFSDVTSTIAAVNAQQTDAYQQTPEFWKSRAKTPQYNFDQILSDINAMQQVVVKVAQLNNIELNTQVAQ